MLTQVEFKSLLNQKKGLIFDIEGTLTNDGRLISGALEVISKLRERGYQLRFLTNMTGKLPEALKTWLMDLGLNVETHEILTSVTTALTYLSKERSAEYGFFAIPESIKPAFSQLKMDDISPDYVVIGDLESGFTQDLLDQILQYLLAGADLISFHKNLYFMRGQKWHIDSGIYIQAFEKITGKEALVTGKPSEMIFKQACISMGLTQEEVMIIGDDLLTDIEGAKRLGLFSLLVGSGKFKKESDIPQSVGFYLNSVSTLLSYL
ncbi:HAD-IIA family hydrolase [Ignatzschineria rhizosphaerae]|uniref:HAD-IIA family hydrolase n=1 Tax=Ignatzschineria rhizosphaerae TaxID=2923279 RepID=A0ABY3XB28_9GAMM|nr:HAD-IIA family hydrolase [Ignatzschineria rhizosphaerae]UNM97158.1 HAD-IIA family hydrolase [Ignatzschineria rhizosphaerae]